MKYTRTKRTAKDFFWTTWTASDIKKQTQQYLDHLSININAMLAIPAPERTFENTYWALETAMYPYHNHEHFLGILANCSDKSSVRDAAREAQSYIHTQSLAIVHRPEVFHALKECPLDLKKLSPELKKFVLDTHRGFVRSGFELPKKEFKQLQKNLKQLNTWGIAFDKNIADYDAMLPIMPKRARDFGLPESYLTTLPKKKGIYHIGATPAQYGPFMSYCTDSLWRKKMSAIVNKKGGKKNLALMHKTLELRQENAQLLGFANHAEYVLKERMAKSPKNVHQFHTTIYTSLAERARKDTMLLKKTKKQDGDASRLEPWDIAYYSRKAQEERFNLDPEEIRQYFQLDRVLDTLFGITEKLFGVTITRKKWKSWHDDVITLEITKGKEVMGYISMDLHPRPGTYTHAMAHNICDAGVYEWGSQKYESPMTAIVANFRGPTKDTPSLLSFGEVTTLFHEFGHALHNTLTTAWIPSQAGFHTVWDFVELPSQIFEEWAWLPGTIKKMSAHVETGNIMPKDMIERLIASRDFLEPVSLTRQIAMAEFDMHIHEKLPRTDLNTLYTRFAKRFSPLPQSRDSLFPASFAHLMHGYDAGYYSYLWSRVYAYECFHEFQQGGTLSSALGKKYWKEILSQGSSRDEMESLTAFLGRSPSVNAFIKHITSSTSYE